MTSIADLELLTKGSHWKTLKGKSSYVLFLTNQALPERVQQKNPPQVVYADEEGNIFNKTIDSFLSERQFYNVDPDLEERLENLFQVPSDVEDVDPLNLEEGPEELSPEFTEDGEEESDDERSIPSSSLSQLMPRAAFRVGYMTEDSPLAEPPLTGQQLAEATALYAEEPPVDGQARHRLDIRLSDEITLEKLEQCFSPILAGQKGNKLFTAFAVGVSDEEAVVQDWDSFIGIYKLYMYGGTYAQIVLATDIPSKAEQQALTELAQLEASSEGMSTPAPDVMGIDPTQVPAMITNVVALQAQPQATQAVQVTPQVQPQVHSQGTQSNS